MLDIDTIDIGGFGAEGDLKRLELVARGLQVGGVRPRRAGPGRRGGVGQRAVQSTTYNSGTRSAARTGPVMEISNSTAYQIARKAGTAAELAPRGVPAPAG